MTIILSTNIFQNNRLYTLKIYITFQPLKHIDYICIKQSVDDKIDKVVKNY